MPRKLFIHKVKDGKYKEIEELEVSGGRWHALLRGWKLFVMASIKDIFIFAVIYI